MPAKQFGIALTLVLRFAHPSMADTVRAAPSTGPANATAAACADKSCDGAAKSNPEVSPPGAKGAGIPSLGAPMLIFKIEFLELNHTRLRQLGYDLTTIDGGDHGNIAASPAATKQTPDAYPEPGIAWIDALKESNLAKVLCNPMLATIPGRRAKFQVGERTSQPAEGATRAEDIREVGTTLELVAGAPANGRVSVNLRSTIINDIAIIEGAVGVQDRRYDVHTCEIETELTLGKTTLIPAARQNRTVAVKDEQGIREVTEEVCLAVLITAEKPEAIDIPVRADGKEAPATAFRSTTLK